MNRLLTALAVLICLQTASLAHELRPGFLEIAQTGKHSYDVRFKVPARGDARLGLYVRLPDQCTLSGLRGESLEGAVMERFAANCPAGLAGHEIGIDGLSVTFTDVVVRVAFADGTVQTARLTPDRPYFTPQAAPVWTATAWTYFQLGVEHILLGIDHLLFVLALLLLVRDAWMLVKVITAFTVAHSLTLAAAALGWAAIPQAPVEAVIALSIMFVAAEALRQRHGGSGITGKAPWLVAFAFGLLHGLGFGGALKEIGLPQSDVPLALLTFNLGVEAGQLVFVLAVVTLQRLTARLLAIRIPWARAVASYGIGTLAAVWFVQRIGHMI